MSTFSDQRTWGPGAPALSPDEVAEARQVGQRLLAEFRPLFDRVPHSARSGLGFARYTGVDRGTSTRFVGAFGRAADGLDVVCQFPGVRGLEQILEALAGKDMPKGALAGAGSAVERFQRLIQEYGGSQTKLIERVCAMRARTMAREPEAHAAMLAGRRREVFESASNLLGQRSEVYMSCHVYRPTPGSSEKMDQAMLRGNLGYRARRDAPPYTFKSFGRNDGPGQSACLGEHAYHPLESRSIDGRPGLTVFEEFSTMPPPLISARGSGKEHVVLIDAERASEDRPIDLVVGQAILNEWRMPSLDTPPMHECSVHMAVPAARVHFDVLLHRSMAQQCLPPTMGVYRTTPGIFAGTAAAHWFDQLPYPPQLRLITMDAASLASRHFPRYPELIADFFDRLGWDRSQFVGYRLEVEYPLWSGFYCMTFEYGGAGA